jgi:hypothetical protein
MLADKLMSAVPSAAPSRGVFMGGGGNKNVIDYIEISTPGNAIDFGDLVSPTQSAGSTSNGSSDRGIQAGGYEDPGASGGYLDVIQYITISTPGNSVDFGDYTGDIICVQACSNGTNDRGIFAGGYKTLAIQSAIRYVTISSTSNTTSFGDLIGSYYNHNNNGCSNGTNDRGIFFSGHGATKQGIDSITISSTGNGFDFGDTLPLQGAGSAFGLMGGTATSNTTGERGVLCGGQYNAITNVIQYITISSAANSIDFGDLTSANGFLAGTSSGSSGDTAVIASIDTPSSNLGIDYFTISTTGNASDFGDLSVARQDQGACSNAD